MLGRGRRGWRPLVVLLLLGALLGGVVHAVTTADPVATEQPAQTYLPADGHVAVERTETGNGATLSGRDTVTESARGAGAALALGGDSSFVSHFVGLALDNPQLPFWRTTTTPATAEPRAQTTRFYRTDGAVALLGESGPDGARFFTPALVELPAAVRAGESWSSSGSAGPDASYRSDLRAQAAPQGCLTVLGTQTVAEVATQVERTWCPGEGMVAATTTRGTEQTRTVRAQLPPLRPATVTAPIRWSDPAAWTARDVTTTSADPTLGPGSMSGSPRPLNPVRTGSGLVVRALQGGGDLVATRALDASTWVSVWRVHPGGEALTVTGFGDVIVVTTSTRRLVAYSASGVRLWERELSEIPPTAPVRLSDDLLAVVSLDGRVQVLGIADGRPGWSRELGSDVTLPPAVGAGLLVVGDRGGTVHALDAASGQPRWTAPLLATALTVTDGDGGGTVWVTQDQTVRALRATDGRHRWLHPFEGTIVGLQPVGTSVLVATKTASQLLDGGGAVVARLDPFLALTPTADHVVGWGPASASVVDATGAVVARWTLPADATVFTDRPAVALPDGVLLADLTWDLTRWGP